MGKVHILPDILAHKIAAGEVVERPASVVKELIENALDAQAKQVLVEAEEGGKRLLSVRDDGVGMSTEDARLAFRHHATSKIHEFEDLSHIQTLGFRGEALPSIASVSRLRMRTIQQDQGGKPLGTEIELEGGTFREVRETAWPQGTEVAVRDLFFNVPARLKFLKRSSTELTRVSRQVTQYALAYPGVEFQFTHQQRKVLAAPRVERLEDRIFQVLGGSFLENLVPIDYQSEGIVLSGFTSVPHEQRSNSNSLYLYVNRRAVRDRILTHAIRLAYKDLMPSGSYPVVVLFVDLDPSEVDVNVHPTKAEIRFYRPNSIYRALHHGIRGALLGHKQSLSHLARSLPSDRLKRQEPLATNGTHEKSNPFSRPGESLSFTTAPRPEPGPEGTTGNAPLPWNQEPAHADGIPETDYIDAAPVVLGQFVESFVVCADRDGILMIDQHVAHERILYDQALAQIESGGNTPTQRLLVPVTFELDPQQTGIAEGLLEVLNGCGFEIDWFGTRTLAVTGLPAIAGNCDAREIITEILDGIAADEFQDPQQRARRLREKIAISLSCRNAIKINTPLSAQKMRWLLDALFRTRNPFTCPHGRPIVLRMGIEEVLKGFKRI